MKPFNFNSSASITLGNAGRQFNLIEEDNNNNNIPK